MRTPEQIKAEIAALKAELAELERKPKQVDLTRIPVDTRLIAPVRDHCYMAQDGQVSGFPAWEGSEPLVWPEGTTIAPDQPWTVWTGGECPVPEGLELEVIFKEKDRKPELGWPELRWDWHGNDGDIIAYRLTGKVLDGWVL